MSVADYPGTVRADTLYTRAELCKRLRWRVHAIRKAKRQGLKLRRFGSSDYILGADVLKFFESIEAGA